MKEIETEGKTRARSSSCGSKARFITELRSRNSARPQFNFYFLLHFFLCGTREGKKNLSLSVCACVQTLVIYRRHVRVNYRELLVKLAAACGVYYGSRKRRRRRKKNTRAHPPPPLSA